MVNKKELKMQRIEPLWKLYQVHIRRFFSGFECNCGS